ncbi:hypothetical protein OG824_05170 [Streptomyces prunicolor]|uniref:hypothetical protein n=1 Tax=Streptomyces prunicolor TaxID=67348 RepID=UPI0022560DDC|nr:hypothetical protein [Streptomyces prunicolor]MCX5234622.1 hypothetical protein [Streptomyces prunicolor]
MSEVIEMTEKTCANCGHSKPVEDFKRHNMTRDGRTNTCKPCLSLRRLSQASLLAPVEPEAGEESVSPQTVTENFDEIVKALGTLDVPDIPWATGLGDLTDKAMTDAFSGVMIAVLRKDYEGARFLLGQTCATWQDVALFLSAVIGDLVDYSIPEEDKEGHIQTEYGIIKKTVRHWN